MTALPSTVAFATIADGSNIVASDHRNNYAAAQTGINGLIAVLSGGTAGQLLQALTSTSVDWNGGTYTSYTPTWTAAGTAPAIGNAVVTAQYARLGKVIHAYGSIVFGNTSTFGTSNYSFALPVTASANAVTALLAGTARLKDQSASFFGQGAVYLASTTTMGIEFGTTYLGTDNVVGQLTPWTWAQTDAIGWNITYEAAT